MEKTGITGEIEQIASAISRIDLEWARNGTSKDQV